ncbi:DUF7344 domain-containing protein [Halovivax cerinus]|uniref:DUF7344 domain-containing protein n=1 Tax=Halovivax cerinus TaxID=1487865 RepID=A0ABD5NIM3_9EURY|nr:hypothetical protein [Halovivax cerinus]
MGAPGGGDESVARSVAHDSPARVCELLANEGSRQLLTTLYERGGTVPVDELGETVAARERVETDADVPASRHARKRLRHAILPRLADTDLVTYDAETDAVTLADRGERLEPYLACASAADVDSRAWFHDRTAIDREETESDARR